MTIRRLDMFLSEPVRSRGGRGETRRDFLRRMGLLGAGLTAQAFVLNTAEMVSVAERRARYAAAWGALPVAHARQYPHQEARIDLNQVGYLPHEPKRAVIAAGDNISGNGFSIVDADLPHRRRYAGMLHACKATGSAEPRACYADFDEFHRPG